MSARNGVKLIGNVGKDAELKHTDKGTAYCNVSIAVNKRYKDDNGETQTLTNWFPFTLWGKKAEVLSNYIKKGSTIVVAGELTTRKRKVGDEEISVIELRVEEVEILSGGKTVGSVSREDEDEDDIGSSYGYDGDE